LTAQSGFFTHQQREEGLTSNWFRALSLNEDDLGRLDDHLILEAISIAAFIGATNRIGIALAVPPTPEYTGGPQH
jgi:hypothetical protein